MSFWKILDKTVRLSSNQVLNYLLQVCAGLKYAHSKDIVHQDIKPGNIFILPNESVKILDFGLACRCGSENFLTGTPFYMSPEQIECLPIDERTDIYSLGITAYEMLTGKRPYPEGDAWSAMEMHTEMDIPNPQEILPDLPQGLCSFIRKACARDKNERYLNIGEAIADLKLLANELGIDQVDFSGSNQRMATLYIFYENEDHPDLKEAVREFKSKLEEIGIESKLEGL